MAKQKRKNDERENQFLRRLVGFLEKEFPEMYFKKRNGSSDGFEFTHRRNEQIFISFKKKIRDFADRNDVILVDNQLLEDSSCYTPEFLANDLQRHIVQICYRQNKFTVSEDVKEIKILEKLRLLFLLSKDMQVEMESASFDDNRVTFYFEPYEKNPSREILRVINRVMKHRDVRSVNIDKHNARMIKFQIIFRDNTIIQGYVNIKKDHFEIILSEDN